MFGELRKVIFGIKIVQKKICPQMAFVTIITEGNAVKKIFSKKTIIILLGMIVTVSLCTLLHIVMLYNIMTDNITSIKKGLTKEKEIIYDNEVSPGVYEVSLIRLIAHPEIYHGKTVVVYGIGNFAFEGNSIFLNGEIYKKYSTKNSVWLNFSEDFIDENFDKLNELNGKYVKVVGVFDAGKHGFFASRSGSLDVISYDKYEK